MKFPFFKPKKEAEKIFEVPEISIKDIITPSSFSLSPEYLKLGERFARTYFVFSYPRYLTTGWLSPVINLNAVMDIALHIHPIEGGTVLKQLTKKLTEVQAEISEREEKGLIAEPALETAFRDLEMLREKLITAQEKVFLLGIYVTVYADDEKQMREIETTLRSILEARLIYIKPTSYQQREGFTSTSPYGMDKLQIHNPMNTGPLSAIFPFVSFDLSSNEGVLYGLNLHNNSLILFDRFTLENANEVVFGKSGSGKSYAIKLEILRYLMLGVGIIVIDPENEYQRLTETIGGSFFNFSLTGPNNINPFDLPPPREDEDPADVLRSNVINLVGLTRIMLGGLTPEEDAIIDRALTETYAAKDITPETEPSLWKERMPLMEDFQTVLEGMEGTESLVRRVGKFTKGTFAHFFNQPTNISMDQPFVVFGIRDMEEELRPIAMFMIMHYIWNTIRAELKKRIFVIDEAWWIMQSEDGASFLYGICKRARKYWLGVTTITTDVNDFMRSSYGQPIIANSSLQLLMKQSPAAIDIIQKTFNLSDGERNALLGGEVGEGLFFAGPKHVLMKIIASYTEDQIITTSPEEVHKIKMAKKGL
ncbi:conjugal transfer protein TraC [Parcubacteria bacterium DG_74_2]|nr:MAG: conjugal transfer protein TraC [Parcubacteria bacterium DG_74_2]